MDATQHEFKPIVIGIEKYDDPSWKPLPGVSAIAARVAKALGGEPLSLPNGGDKNEAPAKLEEAIKKIPERSTLFVHWIGHGVTADQHYLICRDSPSAGPELNQRAAVASDFLGQIIANSKAERVVVVLDTCFSGAGAGDIAEKYRKIMATQIDREGWRRVACVIAASHPLDKAVAGRFSEGLADALKYPEKHLKWSKADQFIIPEDLANAVMDLLGKTGKAINPQNFRQGLELRIFPNPLYMPAAGNTDIETTRLLEGVYGEEGHFNLSSRGIETGEAGYFFSGRRYSQKRIIQWLNDRYANLMVVTGPAGSGKSALIGRIVTLSVPEVRKKVRDAGGLAKDDPVPPDNTIDLAVHAKGKNVFQVATALGRLVGFDREIVDQPGIADLLSAINDADNPLTEEGEIKSLTIVIDALDEAGSEQAQRIANEIIRPLSAMQSVRLLVGTRRSLDGSLIPEGKERHSCLRKTFDQSVPILDLEDEPETHADIAAFVENRLRAALQGQPGGGAWISAAAEKVAEAAGGNFLYARLVARSLEATPDAPLAGMPADASAAFVQDIATRFAADQQRVTDMLRALAFGLGLGLSRAVWAPAATALCDGGATYCDDDIVWMLRHVGSYIVETTVVTDGVGQAVYRLIHQALADHLQREVTLGHAQIVDVLCRGLEGEAWLGADPYLRRHLVDHAVRADREFLPHFAGFISPVPFDSLDPGQQQDVRGALANSSKLERLINTPGLLAISEPAAVLAARKHLLSDQAKRIMGVYRLAAADLEMLPPVERWSVLHLRAMMQVDCESQETWIPLRSSPWRGVWAKTRPVLTHLALKGHQGKVQTVAMGKVNGRAVIVSGCNAGTIYRWDPEAGMAIGDPLNAHGGWGVTSVAMGEVAGRAVIVSGCNDGSIQRWDAEAGMPIGTPLNAHGGWGVTSVAMGEVAGRAVIVSGCNDGSIQRWDAEAGMPIGAPLPSDHRGANSIALGQMDGRAVIVSGGENGTVRLWDAAAGTSIGVPLPGDFAPVKSVALGEVGGRVLIASGTDLADRNDFSLVMLWDARESTPIGDPLTVFNAGVSSVALAQVDGRAVIASGSTDGSVRLWDLQNGTPFVYPFISHHSSVNSVTLGQLLGRAVIVSGGDDGTVRIWDVEASEATDDHRTADYAPVRSIALGDVAGRSVCISGTEDGTVRLWDAGAGTAIGEPLNAERGWVTSVALGEVDGRPMIVSGGANGSLQRWDAEAGKAIGAPITDHYGGVNSVALGQLDGRAVIVSGGQDKTVRLWDAEAGTSIGVPLAWDFAPVKSVALHEVGGRALIVSASERGKVHIWDPHTAAPLTAIHLDQPVWSLALCPSGYLALGTARGLMMIKIRSWHEE